MFFLKGFEITKGPNLTGRCGLRIVDSDPGQFLQFKENYLSFIMQSGDITVFGNSYHYFKPNHCAFSLGQNGVN